MLPAGGSVLDVRDGDGGVRDAIVDYGVDGDGHRVFRQDLQQSRANNTANSFLPARRHASAGTSYGPVSVCLSVCLSQVGVLSKQLNKSSCFMARKLPSTYATLVIRKLRCLQKSGHFPLELCSELWT